MPFVFVLKRTQIKRSTGLGIKCYTILWYVSNVISFKKQLIYVRFIYLLLRDYSLVVIGMY